MALTCNLQWKTVVSLRELNENNLFQRSKHNNFKNFQRMTQRSGAQNNSLWKLVIIIITIINYIIEYYKLEYLYITGLFVTPYTENDQANRNVFYSSTNGLRASRSVRAQLIWLKPLKMLLQYFAASLWIQRTTYLS